MKIHVSAAIECDQCHKIVTEICYEHEFILCEPCHKYLEQECIDRHGAGVRDNSRCERAEIAFTEEE